jgi:hypothetical protein
LGNYLNREFVIDTAGRPYTGEHRYKWVLKDYFL